MKYKRFTISIIIDIILQNKVDAKKNQTILSCILHLKTIQEYFNFKYILQLHDAFVTETHQLRRNLALSVSILQISHVRCTFYVKKKIYYIIFSHMLLGITLIQLHKLQEHTSTQKQNYLFQARDKTRNDMWPQVICQRMKYASADLPFFCVAKLFQKANVTQ